MEEAHPEAADILREAGWAPHDAWQVYTRDTLVMGFQPDGQGFHVKNWAKVQPGDRSYSEDTPDTAEEAAVWLVERFKLSPLSTEATLEPVAIESEAGEDSAHEAAASDDGAASSVAASEAVAPASEPAFDLDDNRPLESGEDGEGFGVGSGQEIESAEVAATFNEPLDADFEDASDLGAELLDDEAFAHGELPAPDPLDFAPDEIEPEPEHSPGAFIFGDNLAHDRIVRIGQLSEHATELIAAAKAGYSDSEHDAVRSHVVTNLNEAGAYVGGNPKLFDRFIELETVTARIRRIEIYRDERQDFIRSADREAVASFDPSQGWP
jgi:hypothetical protein